MMLKYEIDMNVKHILAAFFCLALAGGVMAQTGRDLQDDELHGSVKRVDAVMYEARYDLNDNL